MKARLVPLCEAEGLLLAHRDLHFASNLRSISLREAALGLEMEQTHLRLDYGLKALVAVTR